MASWENNVRRVVPYTPGEQPKRERLIKLNTNESPYPPAPGVIRALRDLNEDALALYPDPEAFQLRDAIARRYSVGSEQVFVGVGSDDVLAMSFLTFFASGRPILFPDITYSFYDVWADLFRIPYEKRPLNDAFGLESCSYFAENGGIIFPNPNAPTGILMDLEQVKEILERNRDVVVIVDEAYIDFATPGPEIGRIHPASALNLLEQYENLLVVQTFSKSRALAGMRIGFAIGNEKLIRYLNDAKFSFNSYTMSRAAIAAGTASVEDDAYFTACVEKIRRTRDFAAQKLRELGFALTPSSANFLFVKHPAVPARELFYSLREEGIIVRFFDKPRIDDHLRITVGTDAQMGALLEFMRRRLS